MHGRLKIAGLLLTLAALQGCGGSSTNSVVDGFMKELLPPSPGEVARDAFNIYDPDQRRRSVNLLSNAPWGGEEPYLRTYRLLVDDPDPTVRAASIRALGRHGGPEDVATIVSYLRDKTSFVRWEAAMALQRLHNESAIDPLIQSVRDDREAEVREAAASALAQYPRERVFQTLVGALNDEDYAVAAQSQEALYVLTGKTFGEDSGQWLAWAEENRNLFADQQRYTYMEYVPPRTMLDRMKFWKKTRVVTPQEPTGIQEKPVAGGVAPASSPWPAATPPPSEAR